MSKLISPLRHGVTEGIVVFILKNLRVPVPPSWIFSSYGNL